MYTHKSKGERPKKSSKVDGGKNKSLKKDAGSGKGGGGSAGVRGQSQSCHQCRQSIHSSKGVSEVKSGRERLKCSQCTRYWYVHVCDTYLVPSLAHKFNIICRRRRGLSCADLVVIFLPTRSMIKSTPTKSTISK